MFLKHVFSVLFLVCPSLLVSITPDAQQALTFFEQIKGDPNTITNKFYRAVMLCELHEYSFALQLYDELLEIIPNSKQVLYNKAYVLKMIGNSSEALQLYRTVVSQDPSNQVAHIGMSHALLTLGHYEEGFKELEWRLVNKSIRQSKAINLETLKNKTVLICCESGLGDQIQCIRYAKILKEHGAYVIAQTYEALIPLMTRCPFVDQVVTKENTTIAADFNFCYFSLPLLCNTVSEKTIPTPIPYFIIDKKIIDFWKQKISPDTKLKIGLSWHSKIQDASFEFSPYRKRSIPLSKLAPLSQIPNASFYSLQRITGLNELKDLPQNFNITTFDTDFDESHGRFMDTAALMMNLDLVITVDTAVAHLAGALGVRTWLLLPATADWRWQLNRSDCPWYPSMRLFRQTNAGNWDEVVKDIKQSLEQFCKG